MQPNKSLLTLFLFLFLSICAFSQNFHGACVYHTQGKPNFQPDSTGSLIAFDYTQRKVWIYSISSSKWIDYDSLSSVQLLALDTLPSSAGVLIRLGQFGGEVELRNGGGVTYTKNINKINTSFLGAGAMQIQSDWNQTNTAGLDFIKNKPTIPTQTSQLTNNSGFLTSTPSLQSVLLSGNTANSSYITGIGRLQFASYFGNPTSVYEFGERSNGVLGISDIETGAAIYYTFPQNATIATTSDVVTKGFSDNTYVKKAGTGGRVLAYNLSGNLVEAQLGTGLTFDGTTLSSTGAGGSPTLSSVLTNGNIASTDILLAGKDIRNVNVIEFKDNADADALQWQIQETTTGALGIHHNNTLLYTINKVAPSLATDFLTRSFTDATYSLTTHNHAGIYEPAFTKNTAFNKAFGTASGQVAEGNHTHTYASLTGTKTLTASGGNVTGNIDVANGTYTLTAPTGGMADGNGIYSADGSADNRTVTIGPNDLTFQGASPTLSVTNFNNQYLRGITVGEAVFTNQSSLSTPGPTTTSMDFVGYRGSTSALMNDNTTIVRGEGALYICPPNQATIGANTVLTKQSDGSALWAALPGSSDTHFLNANLVGTGNHSHENSSGNIEIKNYSTSNSAYYSRFFQTDLAMSLTYAGVFGGNTMTSQVISAKDRIEMNYSDTSLSGLAMKVTLKFKNGIPNYVILNLPVFNTDAEANASANLESGAMYRIGNDLRIKP